MQRLMPIEFSKSSQPFDLALPPSMSSMVALASNMPFRLMAAFAELLPLSGFFRKYRLCAGIGGGFRGLSLFVATNQIRNVSGKIVKTSRLHHFICPLADLFVQTNGGSDVV